jgi:hypothetical protein
MSAADHPRMNHSRTDHRARGFCDRQKRQTHFILYLAQQGEAILSPRHARLLEYRIMQRHETILNFEGSLVIAREGRFLHLRAELGRHIGDN